MIKLIGPCVTELLQYVKENLEVICLLGANHINQGIEWVIIMPPDRRPDILSDVYGGSILS